MHIHASSLYGGITTPNSNVFTYPSLSRHDTRYWNNTRYLFEELQPRDINPEFGSLSCVENAVDTLSQSMPYYAYYYNRDTKIITNMDNVPSNVGIVIFSSFLTQEAGLLPSAEGYEDLTIKDNIRFLSAEGNGDLSPVLYLSSLLKIMCPLIISRTGYERQNPKNFYDYVLFQYNQ